MQKGFLLATMVMLVSTGLIQRLWIERRERSTPEIAAALQRLDRLPLELGDWRGREERLDPQVADAAGIVGYRLRQYTNQRTGLTVSMLLVGGRSGPISLHPPDICYPGVGFEPMAKPIRHSVTLGESGSADFSTTLFTRETGTGPQFLRVFWAWSADGTWDTPDSPRLTYAGAPSLYKLYFQREMAAADSSLTDEPCLELVRELLPSLNDLVFSSTEATSFPSQPSGEKSKTR